MNKLLHVLLLCLLMIIGAQTVFAKDESATTQTIDGQLQTKMQTMLSTCPETVKNKLFNEFENTEKYPKRVGYYVESLKELLLLSDDSEPKLSGECRFALLNVGEYLLQEHYDFNDFISNSDNSASILKKHPKFLLNGLNFAYALNEANSLNIQKEYLNRGEQFVQELKSAYTDLNCAIDAPLFSQYVFSKKNFTAGTFEQRIKRQKDILERTVRWGKNLELCSFPYPDNAFVSARFILAQSELFVVRGPLLDEFSKEESVQARATIEPYAIKWVKLYSDQMGCKKILSTDGNIKYENDKQFFLETEKRSACFSAVSEVFSKNLIFGYDHKTYDTYRKLVLSDSKTDILEFTQDCSGLLKITPSAFGEKQNYAAFRAMIEPACQKQVFKKQ